MAALGQLVDQARAKDARFALIGGEAGVGKTRLVRELADRASAAGFLVLTGHCVELGAEGLAILLACVNGAGAILVEIMTETGLQRMLSAEVFGRAYGLAIPASIAGIAVGSLIAPLLVDALGLNGALAACGAIALGYGLQLLARWHVPARPSNAESLAPVQ
jgi:MFS family permease